jgi:hypothetical protein
MIDLIILDSILFSGGTTAAIIDLTQSDATKKLKGKTAFAFERLPQPIKEAYEIKDDSNSLFSFRLKGTAGDALSQVEAGMHARGDTYQIEHISEWGKVAFTEQQPQRGDHDWRLAGGISSGPAAPFMVEQTALVHGRRLLACDMDSDEGSHVSHPVASDPCRRAPYLRR